VAAPDGQYRANPHVARTPSRSGRCAGHGGCLRFVRLISGVGFEGSAVWLVEASRAVRRGGSDEGGSDNRAGTPECAGVGDGDAEALEVAWRVREGGGHDYMGGCGAES